MARRWQVCSQQVFTWRREARAGRLALPSEVASSGPDRDFVPVVAQQPAISAEARIARPAPECAGKSLAAPAIEIRLAGASVRVVVGTDCTMLADVLRAVRTSAA